MMTNKSAILTTAAGAALAVTLLGACDPVTSSSANGGSTTTPSTSGSSTGSGTGTSGGTTGGNSSGGGSGATGTSGSSVPRCHTTDLTASFTVVKGSAGAGNIVYNIDLKNTSSQPCTVYGYPGMLLLDAKHAPLPTNVQRSTIVAKTYVTLIPNGDASASARFSPDIPGPGEPTSGACEPTAAFTEITPPDETTQLVTAVGPPTSVCEHGGMQVSAFVPGATGPGEG
ncbi:MAG TPA: DUF4232 domain-containing protein [Actinocrinis sp.]|jgi:hypothetical protein|uniref:DUF4232 domain-containing protein n=1 Tax=Actinocrinis sp. TaxID=1920516 RepID=UPI002DDCA642|nr:DUF4232 domain-containing protein [Actinocrinis sp.]HEV3172754.1 DUF4232 domain-containing protein [Actinocrinis sp.]